LYDIVPVVETKGGTISVASAFPGHHQGNIDIGLSFFTCDDARTS